MGEVDKKISPYKKGDLFIYILIAVIVLALFLAFVIFPGAKKTDGIIIRKHGKDIVKVLFEKEEFSFLNDGEKFVIAEKSSDGVIIFTVKEDGSHYNVVKVDCINKSAKVTDANCSTSKDCVYSPAVSDGKGAIVCEPHELLIIPITGEYTPIVIG